MRKITLFIPENVPLSSLAIPIDVFLSAGVFWNQLFKKPPKPLFKLKTITIDGNPIRTIDGLEIKPDGSIYDTVDSDTIIIAPVADPLQFSFPEGISWLRRSHARGAHIASICTGAFLLAETGLLNGKTATTHWGFAKAFQKRFPDVILQPEKMMTDAGDLFCSGGANAGGDLCLYLVEKYSDRKLALQTARALVMDMDRNFQSTYFVSQSEKSHCDDRILIIQNWIENHFDEHIHVDLLAKNAGMSRRTFERRFKNATGDSPLKYLQLVRVENAKQLLEQGDKTFDEITYHVGYQDSSTFSRVFKGRTGISPNAYRNKYGFSR